MVFVVKWREKAINYRLLTAVNFNYVRFLILTFDTFYQDAAQYDFVTTIR